jgi:hypothetical protein
MRFTALGVVLCVLAFLFAFEAKLAWFSPLGSPPSQISAAKLQPADASKQIAAVLAAPGVLHPMSVGAAQALLFALPVLIVDRRPVRRAVRDRFKVCSFPGFIPSLFVRPPPKY